MQEIFSKDQAFPMLGYVYNLEGRYRDPVIIRADYELLLFLCVEVTSAFIERREIRITDRTGDDMLFHLQDGQVLWCGGGDTVAIQTKLKLLTDPHFPAPRPKEPDAFQTKHNLVFERSDYAGPFKDDGWIEFRIGTCEGLYRVEPDACEILVVINKEPGNGHFEDVLEYFERDAQRAHVALRILELWNTDFRTHLITKRGFLPDGEHVVKHF